MITETRKVIALATVIVAAGIGAVEMTRGSAQADPMIVAGGAAGYAGARVDRAFEIVAGIPAPTRLSLATAEKGDLLGGMNVAYGVPAGAEVLEAERGVSSSILTRLAHITVAGF